MSTTPESLLLEAFNLSRAELIEELRAQGHELTGALAASITAQTSGEEMNVLAYAYLQKLEHGVPASQIQINSQTLGEMARYVEQRMGYRGSKALQVAHLILQKQQQEGSPTSGSYAFSATGERTGAIADTFRKLDPVLDQRMSDGLDRLVDDAFGNEPDELTI
jgi:hypothetical protein